MAEIGNVPQKLESLLIELLDKTPDGFAIFSPDDRVIYTNPNYARLFDDTPDGLIGKTFRQASLQVHQSPRGLNIDTDNIESWIDYALSKRRQQSFRSFHTDTTDGRWMLLTEQMLEDGHMLVYFTDITTQKSAELQLQQLSEKLRHYAQTDSLTDTNNRRYFMELLKKELQRCRRDNKTCALLIIDIDHFKQINDHYGHPCGDKILITFVKLLNKTLRPYDILGRIGGEEFAVLVPEADRQMAERVGERLRLAVEQQPFDYQTHSIQITASIGMIIDNAGKNITELFKGADQALYQAKQKGRNQLQICL